jgi:hypothetical protein
MCVCSLSYPACKAHAPYYIVICGLSGCTIFFHIISQTARFSGKKLLNIKCVFCFHLQILSETFLVLRRMQRSTVINVHRSSYPLFLSDFNELKSSRHISEKYSNTKFHENPSIGSRIVLCGKTDRYDKLTVAFRNLRTPLKR